MGDLLSAGKDQSNYRWWCDERENASEDKKMNIKSLLWTSCCCFDGSYIPIIFPPTCWYFKVHTCSIILYFLASQEVIVSVFWWFSSPSVWRRRALCCWTEPAARRILNLTLKTYVRVSGHYVFNIFGAFLPSNSLFLWRNSPSIAQRPYSSSACSTVLHHRSAVWVGLPAAVWQRCKAPGMFKI